jgi:hypothetical protein
MSRKTLLIVVVAVLAVVGVPVAMVALAGDGDGGDSRVVDGRTVFPEGIDTDNAPPEQVDPEPEGKPERASAKDGGGAPQHAKSFDRSMEGVGYPNAITDDGGPAVVAVERALGPEVEAGQQTVIAADCRKGVCSVRYRAEGRGTGQIIAAQQRIMRSLFGRDGVRRVVLYVHHKTVGRKKEERPAFIVVTCTRTAGFAWERITARQIPRRCEVVDNAGGRLRSETRRGRVSVDDASRGRGAEQGGQAGSGPSGGRGMKPEGSAAPENVNPKGEEPETGRGGRGGDGR